MKKINYSLYFIADPEITGNRDITEISETALKSGISMLQLRAKNLDGHDFYILAKRLKALSDAEGIPFLVNDRLDIALAVDADGVHLGQRDMPCCEARRLMGQNRIIGITADNIREAQRAFMDRADYVGYGAIFETGSKTDTRIKSAGIKGLEKFCRECRLPVVAIGGINPSNASECIKAGASGIAVISAISMSGDIETAVRQLRRATGI